MSESKILSFDGASVVFDQLRAEGKRIVQCHGTFDLIHPGHMVHLEEAKDLGDVLVVTVTAEKYVNKGPGRPCFNDAMRARSLAALTCVDYVVLIPYPAAVEAIRLVRPNIYCKGREYEDAAADVTGNIRGDIAAVEECGGEIRYIGSVVFSSTKLLNRHFDYLSSEIKNFCRDISLEFGPTTIRDEVERFRDLKILVIGDTIIDQYTYLKVQGLTSKNRIISGRYLRQETHLGGALAAMRHVKQFCDNVQFISLLGAEPWLDDVLKEALAPHEDLTIRDPGFTTVIKKRYVEPLQGGNEMMKLFSVNFIDADPPKASTQSHVMDRIREHIRGADAVLLLDFGHGLMQPAIRECVQEEAPFLVVNCQTNSNNHGYNIISRQYQRMDAFSLDQQEIMLACGAQNLHFETELHALKEKFGATYAWLTRGSVMTIGLKTDEKTVQIPPLDTDVVDTVGAGDAFFSVAGLAAARGLPANFATFLGQLAGAQAVKIVGNARPISKASLLKSAMSLLNF
jgi:rfaE bifunctional protein nucleotidyltransferase chain/domain